MISHLFLDSEDQILQLIKKTLNLIKQVINVAITKVYNQLLRLKYCWLTIKFKNLLINIKNIYEKDWRPKQIGFFNSDYKKSGLIITINCYIYS